MSIEDEQRQALNSYLFALGECDARVLLLREELNETLVLLRDTIASHHCPACGRLAITIMSRGHAPDCHLEKLLVRNPEK
jgi:hypothetical protein